MVDIRDLQVAELVLQCDDCLGEFRLSEARWLVVAGAKNIYAKCPKCGSNATSCTAYPKDKLGIVPETPRIEGGGLSNIRQSEGAHHIPGAWVEIPKARRTLTIEPKDHEALLAPIELQVRLLITDEGIFQWTAYNDDYSLHSWASVDHFPRWAWRAMRILKRDAIEDLDHLLSFLPSATANADPVLTRVLERLEKIAEWTLRDPNPAYWQFQEDEGGNE